MTISSFQILNILKTYDRHVRSGQRKASRDKVNPSGRDRVEIPVEGRRKQVYQKAAGEVVEKLTRGENPGDSSPERSGWDPTRKS